MIAHSGAAFPRERLFVRMDAARRAPVAFVVAGPERGKSTAVREYLAARAVDHVRLDLGPELAGPSEFVAAFAAAFNGLAPAMRASVTLAASRLAVEDDPAPVVAWAREHLAGTRGTVVIDGLDAIASTPRAVAFLRDVIDATVPELGWILVTRDAAAFPLARWLATGLAELPVDEDDLRVELDELEHTVAAAGLPLDPELRELHRHTNGSPFRLAVALRASGTAELATSAEVYDRLVDDALARAGDGARDHLFISALLGRFSAAMLASDGADADRAVAPLLAAGFVYREGRHDYAYHEPFRERLAAQAERLPQEPRTALLRRAADALAVVGRWRESVALEVRAGDSDRLLRALDARGFAALEFGELAIVREAFAVLADDAVERHPTALGVRAALASLDERFDIAEAWFRMAIISADEARRAALVIRFGIDLVRRGRTDAVQLLEREIERLAGDRSSAAQLAGLLATAYVAVHRLADARAAAARALRDLDAVEEDGSRARVFHQAAYVALNDGDFAASQALAERALGLAEGAYHYDLAARALSVLHNLALAADDAPAARRYLLELDGCARKAGSSTLLLYALLNRYELEVTAGDQAAIERIDAELRRLTVFLTPMASESLLPAQALRASWDGRFEHAFSLLELGAEKQYDPERQAHRWAEAAMYAAAAGLRRESMRAIRRSRAILARTESAELWPLRAYAYLAVAEVLLGFERRARAAIAQLEQIGSRGGPRFCWLVDAVRALHVRWTTGWYGQPELSDVLDRLRAVDFGGIARFIEALPTPDSGEGNVKIS